MAHSPSKRWENGVLIERALVSPGAEEENEAEAQATKPYKTPVPTLTANNRKRIESAENKAVGAKKAAKK